MRKVYLHSIAAVVPKYEYSQDLALKVALDLIAKTPGQIGFLEKIYAGSRIQKRYSVLDDFLVPPEAHTFYPKNKEFLPEPGLKERNDRFMQEADDLSAKAAGALFSRSPIRPDQITHLITVSCTGFSAPGFDWSLVKKFNLPKTVNRFHLGFMGCYAAFPAMRLARDICLADPTAKVMIVNVEICSLHFQLNFDLNLQVANALFSDGVSAAVVSSDPAEASGPTTLEMADFYGEILPGSEKDMTWQIGERAFDMRLSAFIPELIQKNINPFFKGFTGRTGLSRDDVDIWAIHPGGKSILQKFGETLHLEESDLKVAYSVLRDFGNMSSATIMFVLAEILRQSETGNIFAAAFGPGLTMESGYLKGVPANAG